VRYIDAELPQSLWSLLPSVLNLNEWRVLFAQRAAARGATERARSLFLSVLERRPNHAQSHLCYADFLAGIGELDAAEAEYETACGLSPNDPTVLNNCAVFFDNRRDDADAAIHFFSRAADVAPQWSLPCRNLAAMYARRGRMDEAERAFLQALTRRPNSQPALRAYAAFLADVRDDLAQADHYYERAMDAFGCDHPTLIEYALFCWQRLGDVDRAQEYIERALELGPRDPLTHGTYGAFLHDARKDYRRALSAYREALELDSQNAWVKCNLGGMLCETGQVELGLEMVREGLAAAVSSPMRLEAWFCVLVHGSPDDSPAARGHIEELLDQGVRSPHWDLSVHLTVAASAGRTDIASLTALAARIRSTSDLAA
jgi:Tfp pilus assembly protein PilF